MAKVFLYLYPIEEFTRMFLYDDDFYDEFGIERPLPILNDTINKRYRENGFQVVFALYPDKELYGIKMSSNDKIIYTDILFSEASAIDEFGKDKINFIPKYPDEKFLLKQLGCVDELVVGGYHAMDCVKRVASVALQNGINTLVDLDLTDLFFNLYNNKEYFDQEIYDPYKFIAYTIGYDNIEFMEMLFKKNYSNPVYGFNTENSNIVKWR